MKNLENDIHNFNDSIAYIYPKKNFEERTDFYKMTEIYNKISNYVQQEFNLVLSVKYFL